MSRNLWAFPSILLAVWGAWGSALAGEPDQSNEGPLLGGTSIGVIGAALNQSAAQVITVGITGRLDRVDMYVYAAGVGAGTLTSPLVLEIHNAAGGLPSDQVLAMREIRPSPSGLQWVTFDLSALSISVIQSQQLALVLRSTQDLTQGEYDAEGSRDVYQGGGSYYRSFSGPWMPLADYDLMFRTYVFAPTCCNADFNHDNEVLDDDIEAFFSCLAGHCCPTCDSPDFNCDGDTATDADIESFFRVLAGGSC